MPGGRAVAICFADMVGFTSLSEQLEIEELGEVTQRFTDLAGEVAEPPVRLVKTIGDEAMLASEDPERARRAVARADRRGRRRRPAAAAAGRRRGGDAVRRAGDWYGRPVNLAARITAVAPERRPGRRRRAARGDRGVSAGAPPAAAASRGSTARSTSTGSRAAARFAGVRRPSRDKLIVLALVAGSYLLALLQRPGEASSDTKIDLHVDPVGFLGDVAQVWTPTGSLGHVQGGQYGGYLWPMGPFFARAELARPVRRGSCSGSGSARCWRSRRGAPCGCWTRCSAAPRGVAHAVAGALMVLNPYVVVFANRTSVTLLAYAALPWLLLAVHRGLREPRRWLVAGGVRADRHVHRRRA